MKRILLVLVSLSLFLAACGTRVDKEAYFRSLGTQTEAPGEVTSTEAGRAAGPTSAARTTAGGPGEAASKTQQGGRVAGGGAAGPRVSDKVVGETINIGFHVPVTGAAPLPADFLDIIKAIEEYFNAEKPLYGRKFRFLVEDDGYDPTKGLAACRKLAGEDVLFVIGHTMPAAEDACAKLLGDAGIPYLIRGTYPEILNGRPLLWAATASDDVQGRLLADYVLKRLGGKGRKAAVVYQNDQVSARDNFIRRFQEGGGQIVAVESSVPRQPDFGPIIQKLQSAGAEFVLLSMPPVDAIKISVQAQGQGYHPIWLGGGTWWNYNMVLESAGSALDGAIVLSPWPTIDSAAADEFKAVWKKYRPNKEPEDLGLIVWGWANLVYAAMEKAGPQLSRASFVAALNNLGYNRPYWAPIRYTPTDHRGTNYVAVFRADAQAKRWRQVTGFVTGF